MSEAQTPAEAEAEMQHAHEPEPANIVALAERLRSHDTLRPPQTYWIQPPEGGVQHDPDGGSGIEWCEEHAEDLLMRLNLYTPGDGEYTLQCLDGGGIYDTIPRCSECGMMLAGWPTRCCEDNQLFSFECDTEWLSTPENIHVIRMALSNLAWGGGADAETVAAWMAVGEVALAKIEAAIVFPDGSVG